jgi:hypothetical protein
MPVADVQVIGRAARRRVGFGCYVVGPSEDSERNGRRDGHGVTDRTDDPDQTERPAWYSLGGTPVRRLAITLTH